MSLTKLDRNHRAEASTLKDGRKVTVRPFQPPDREALVSMYASLSRETLRWALPPYDRSRVDRMTSDLDNKISLVALSDSRIVGHLNIYNWLSERTKGIAELLIYLHQDFQNVGLGTTMMLEGIRLARKRGWHRIGLKVVADNDRGIRSYEKVGFQKEGIIRDSYFGDDGQYHDEVEMGLLL